ncbi:unnamed protein product [Tuber melanosporum]|uniref:18S rRNA factor 2 n=1 Tax=Tuber melanosporum (strain Mel28) TaxID=656061 RepID=D5G923_TUBMM|nr:uncharacterized protein GSTUM_00004953001 [Tuber melanosporum]CAZ81016.1 unnamed protein product [Tuber melanosporum]
MSTKLEDNKKKQDWLVIEDSEEEGTGDDSEQEEEESRLKELERRGSKRYKVDHASPASEDDDDGEIDGGDSDASGEEDGKEIDGKQEGTREKGKKEGKNIDKHDDLLITSSLRLKPLSKEELAASKEATSKTGVVYLSRIPPFMKPMKVKLLLSRFGEIGRIFLSPEDPKSYARRVRFGGNKKRNFEEGWVEFKSKKVAKLVAETLNTTIVGGKKGSYYHDDVWNIKYLPKFKWHHLQAQIAYENASRQAKLRAEIAQATRENKTYIRNAERAKMVEKMESSKKRKLKELSGASGDNDSEQLEPLQIRRQFRQHSAKGRRAEEGEGRESSEKVKRLLSKVF